MLIGLCLSIGVSDPLEVLWTLLSVRRRSGGRASHWCVPMKDRELLTFSSASGGEFRHDESVEFVGADRTIPERHRVEEHELIDPQERHKGQIFTDNVAPVDLDSAERCGRGQKTERGTETAEVEPTVAIQNVVIGRATGGSSGGVLKSGGRIDKSVEEGDGQVALCGGHVLTGTERGVRVGVHEARESGVLGGRHVLPEEDGFKDADEQQMEREADAPPVGNHRGRMGWWRIGWSPFWRRRSVQREWTSGEEIVARRRGWQIHRFPREAHRVVFLMLVLWGLCRGRDVQQQGLLVGQNPRELYVTFAEGVGATRALCLCHSLRVWTAA